MGNMKTRRLQSRNCQCLHVSFTHGGWAIFHTKNKILIAWIIRIPHFIVKAIDHRFIIDHVQQYWSLS